MMSDYEALKAFCNEYDIRDATIRYRHKFGDPSTIECSIPLISVMRLLKDLGFLPNTDDKTASYSSQTDNAVDISYLSMMGFEE